MSVPFIDIVVKISLLVAAAATINMLLFRRMSAGSRHLVWTLAIAGLLLLPILSAALPSWEIAIRAEVTHPGIVGAGSSMAATATGPAPGTPIDRLVPWATALPVLYAAGVFLLLIRLVVERRTVQRLARHAADVSDPEWTALLLECAGRIGVQRRVRLSRSLERTMPMTFGIRAPEILIPAVADTWSEDRRRAVLLHELAHVARHDCLTQLMASVACAVYWIHPGVWWIARRLRVERELACDDCVLAAGTHARDYAGHLLELAYTLGGRPAPALAVSMARPRQLEGRMLAVLDAARNRAAPALRSRMAGIALTAALVVPLAAAQTTVVPPDGNNPPRDHGVSPEYVRELGALGYQNVTLDELKAARDHGVNAEYIRELTALGYERLSLDSLNRLRDHGVTPQFVRGLKDGGQVGLTVDELIVLRDRALTPDRIRDVIQHFVHVHVRAIRAFVDRWAK